MSHAKLFLLFGTIFGALSVVSGAFGAHALEARVQTESLETWETAAKYQIYHALLLLFIGWLCREMTTFWLVGAGWAAVGGVIVFSGSLYTLVLSGQKWLGMITPIGGLALIGSWLMTSTAIFLYFDI